MITKIQDFQKEQCYAYSVSMNVCLLKMILFPLQRDTNVLVLRYYATYVFTHIHYWLLKRVIDNFDRLVIRRNIYEMFDRKVQVTVSNLLTELKNAYINVVININFKIHYMFCIGTSIKPMATIERYGIR